MHSFTMRIKIAARRKCATAKWAREFAYAGVLGHVVEQRVLQFECFSAHLAGERFQIGMLYFDVIAQTLPIQG